MEREFALSQLRENEAELRGLGVDHLYLFGSVARNTAKTGSDVDLFFDFSDARFSLIDLITVKDRLTALLGDTADIMTRGSLHPALRADIERSAMQVF